MKREQKIEFIERFFNIPIQAESKISQEILTMFEEYADVDTLHDMEARYDFLNKCYSQLSDVYNTSLSQYKNGEIDDHELEDVRMNLEEIREEMDDLEKKLNRL